MLGFLYLVSECGLLFNYGSSLLSDSLTVSLLDEKNIYSSHSNKSKPTAFFFVLFFYWEAIANKSPHGINLSALLLWIWWNIKAIVSFLDFLIYKYKKSS